MNRLADDAEAAKQARVRRAALAEALEWASLHDPAAMQALGDWLAQADDGAETLDEEALDEEALDEEAEDAPCEQNGPQSSGEAQIDEDDLKGSVMRLCTSQNRHSSTSSHTEITNGGQK